MTAVIADSSLQRLLSDLKERAEIRDAAGNLLGYYTPRGVEEASLYERAAVLFKPDELERLSAQHNAGFSIDEMWKRIESMERS